MVLFYYYNDSLDTIVALERERSKCQQGVDTISAQLQVVYEHKSRLEKSFQQEKENFATFKSDQDRSAALLKQKFEALKKQIDDIRLENNKLTGKYDNLKLERQRQIEENAQNLRKINEANLNLKKNSDELVKEINALKQENAELKNRLQFAQQNLSKLNPIDAAYVAAGRNLSITSLNDSEIDVLRVHKPFQKENNPKLEQLVLQRPQSERVAKVNDRFVAQENEDVAKDVVFERHRSLPANEQQSDNVLPAPDLNRHAAKRLVDSDKANEEDEDEDRGELPIPVRNAANEQYIADVDKDLQR